MSVRSNIRRDAGWFRYEGKTFTIPVLDDTDTPVDLSTTDLVWHVLKEQGSSTKLLEKTTDIGGGVTVSGPDDNEVVITVLDTDYANLPAGNWYHELWDSENKLLLSYGDAYLHASRGAVIP